MTENSALVETFPEMPKAMSFLFIWEQQQLSGMSGYLSSKEIQSQSASAGVVRISQNIGLLS